jgi:hypothetical protein
VRAQQNISPYEAIFSHGEIWRDAGGLATILADRLGMLA